MIPLDEARQYVLDRVARLASARVPLADAAGLVLAADVVAAEQVPPFANTAMDGFAVRAQDLGAVRSERSVKVPISQEIPAGAFPEGRARTRAI